MRVSTRGLAILLGVGIAALASGCAASRLATVTANVPASSTARSAAVELNMDTGDLSVTGAGTAFVVGTLADNQRYSKPTVTSGSQPSTAGVIQTAALSQNSGPDSSADAQATWTVQLGGGLPTDVAVSKAAGNSDLDLSLVDVKDMSVTAASGRLAVKLGGPHPSLSHVSFTNASGETTIDASGEYPALEAFAVRSESGAVSLDISGTWGKTFTGSVVTGSGAITVVLPSKVNVRVEVSTAHGKVTAQGLTWQDAAWVYRPAPASPYTLTLNVTSITGDVNLSVKK